MPFFTVLLQTDLILQTAAAVELTRAMVPSKAVSPGSNRLRLITAAF
jgi:hypothetical protein